MGASTGSPDTPVASPPPYAERFERTACAHGGGGYEHDDVEVNQVGRSGAQSADGLSVPNRQALAALEPGLTVLMFGTNEEGMALGGDTAEAERRLTQGIVRSARLARRSGGCVVVPHAPNNRRSCCSGVSRGLRPSPRGQAAAASSPCSAGYELMGKQIAGLILRYCRR